MVLCGALEMRASKPAIRGRVGTEYLNVLFRVGLGPMGVNEVAVLGPGTSLDASSFATSFKAIGPSDQFTVDGAELIGIWMALDMAIREEI